MMSSATARQHPAGGIAKESSEERLRELAASTPDAEQYMNLFGVVAPLSDGRLYRDSHAGLLAYNEIDPAEGGSPLDANARDHRKLLVVDGACASTGGVNIDAPYRRGSEADHDGDPVSPIHHAYFEAMFIHAKTAVIDGVWSTVGSSNLDPRSFLHNDEVNAVILGQDFARQLERQFEKDVEECNAVKLEDWKGRPVPDRVRERLCRVLSYWI